MGVVGLVASVLSLYRVHICPKIGLIKCSSIFLILPLYNSGLCTAAVSLAIKLRLRKFEMILSDSLMRAAKSTSTKKRKPSLSDVEKQFQAKIVSICLNWMLN